MEAVGAVTSVYRKMTKFLGLAFNDERDEYTGKAVQRSNSSKTSARRFAEPSADRVSSAFELEPSLGRLRLQSLKRRTA
jgi:hypothetical protein